MTEIFARVMFANLTVAIEGTCGLAHFHGNLHRDGALPADGTKCHTNRLSLSETLLDDLEIRALGCLTIRFAVSGASRGVAETPTFYASHPVHDFEFFGG